MTEQFETGGETIENGEENAASEVLGVAIERAMKMVGVGESDEMNRAEHIPTSEEVEDLRKRTKRYLDGAATKADLTAGLEKGNLVAVMQFVAQEVEQRGL